MKDQNFASNYRRETGQCRICWSADAAADVGVSTDINKAYGVTKVRLRKCYQKILQHT